MKKIILILISLVVMSMLFAGCFGSKTATVEVAVGWEDESYVDFDTKDWYVAISKGSMSVSTDIYGEVEITMENSPFEYQKVTAGENKTIKFNFELEEIETYSMLSFMDENGDGKYQIDTDILNDYTKKVIGPDDSITVNLNPYY